MTTKQPVRAVIVEPGVPGRSEPYAQILEGPHAGDPFPMPMGGNFGREWPRGTEGVAEYVMTGHSGLWHFTPTGENVTRLVFMPEGDYGLVDRDDETVVEASGFMSRREAVAWAHEHGMVVL